MNLERNSSSMLKYQENKLEKTTPFKLLRVVKLKFNPHQKWLKQYLEKIEIKL